MRWPTTKIGTVREVRRFAVLPTTCVDGTTRWLEDVVLHQVFYPSDITLSGGGWVTMYADAVEGK